MRRIAALFLLLFSRVIFGCDMPRGVPVSDLRFVPDCGMGSASLAVSAGGAFAAWHFSHVGFGFITGTNYGSPLDAVGRSKVDTELPLQGANAFPSLASDGHDYLLVLSDNVASRATIVHPDGSSGPLQTIATNDGWGIVGLVWTGSDYLFVNHSLTAVRLSPAGVVTNVNVLTMGATLAALANGIVIWKRGMSVEAAPIGGPAVSLPMIPATATMSVASSGHGFLVVFTDTDGRVGAQRLDIGGNPIGGVIEIVREAASPSPATPQVAFEGDSFLALWQSGWSVRAAHVSASGAVSAPFIVAANAVIWSAVPSRDGTMIAYGAGCGAVATRVIGRGANSGTPESVVSLRADVQSNPIIAATALGHQVVWHESSSLFTRFVSSSGPTGPTMKLSSDLTINASIIPFAGGTVAVWDDGSNAPVRLRIARFNAGGNMIGEPLTIPSTAFVFSISIAAAGDELLVVTSGEDDVFKNEVDAARLDASLNVLQRVVLSNPGEDGYYAPAGGDASRWFAAWRDGAAQLVVVEMAHGDLHQQTRFSTTLATSVSAYLGGILPGDDPAVMWTDSNVHATYYHSGLDILVAGANVTAPRVIGSEAFWLELTPTTTRILSAPISKSTAPAATERACLAIPFSGLGFDVRNGAIDAIAYPDTPQLRVQLRGVPRRRIGPTP
jgi:hypothetical protein